MDIELKNIKVSEHLSEETIAYSASVYVDGKRWGTTSNCGRGGPDEIRPLRGGRGELAKLTAIAKGQRPDAYEPLDELFGDLVQQHRLRKRFKADLRHLIAADSEGTLFTWKNEPTPGTLANFREKYGDKYRPLNDMPEADAYEIWLNYNQQL